MSDESIDTATPARPAARPKAKPRYQPEPDRPAGLTRAESSRAAKAAKPAKVEPAKPAKVESARPAKVKPSEPVAPVAGKAATEAHPRRRADLSRLKRPATICTALLAAAAAFAGYALVSWISAGNDDTAHFAKARDAVLLDARQDIVVLNQLDYRNIDGGLKRWLDATTGDLHDQLANVSPADRKDISTAKKTSSGKVIDAAVTELDNRAGTATVIATVETTVSPSNGAPPKRNRFKATMARVDGGWKLSALDQVTVSMS
jgi:Mce-associated membrane protein